MRYGRVVRYFPEKGYGFIRPDRGPDIFFHITALGACSAEPEIRPGQPVKYELEPGTEPKPVRRSRAGPQAPSPERPPPRAMLVELIDRIPGGSLEDPADARHPRARRKKPTWRR